MKNYRIQKSPFTVPTTEDKLIQEHWGDSMNTPQISIARMVAPPGWSEPHQTPDFDEFTLIVSGKKQIEIDGDTVVLQAGESILVNKGARVRYSNPFDSDCEYIAVCTPAFSPESVHREEP
ncbi:MAG: cupin domain-containing protein [Chryseobacterium sp.]|nr:MAG: cupin domain-containing protein [Chryseobacterium sp.]